MLKYCKFTYPEFRNFLARAPKFENRALWIKPIRKFEFSIMWYSWFVFLSNFFIHYMMLTLKIIFLIHSNKTIIQSVTIKMRCYIWQGYVTKSKIYINNQRFLLQKHSLRRWIDCNSPQLSSTIPKINPCTPKITTK